MFLRACYVSSELLKMLKSHTTPTEHLLALFSQEASPDARQKRLDVEDQRSAGSGGSLTSSRDWKIESTIVT